MPHKRSFSSAFAATIYDTMEGAASIAVVSRQSRKPIRTFLWKATWAAGSWALNTAAAAFIPKAVLDRFTQARHVFVARVGPKRRVIEVEHNTTPNSDSAPIQPPIPQINNDEEEIDVNLEFSSTDTLTSTPPRNITTGINWTSPSIHAPSPSTPVRENLFKEQLRRQPEPSPQSTVTTLPLHEINEPSSPAIVDSPLPQDIISSPLPEVVSPVDDTAGSPHFLDIDSSPFQSDTSSPFQLDVGSPSPQRFEDDFLFIDDDSPVLPRRTVRWTREACVKPFYYDEKVDEMLDSTLESINFNPVRRQLTFEDDLDESEPSTELLEDLSGAEENEEPSDSDNEPKPLIAPLDLPEIESLYNIVEACDEGRKADYAIVDGKLKARDFATLLPGLFNGDPRAWLNDNIVNEYLDLLAGYCKRNSDFEHNRGGPAPPVHAFSSFWYTNVKKSVESVKRWAARFQLAGSQYLDADLVLYPICDAGHWRLIAVMPKARTIEYLDSLGFNGKPYTDKVLEYLKMELKDAYIPEEWTVVEAQRSSRQMNGSDCGVFTLLNALALLRGEDFDRVIACDGMEDARQRIATSLMAGFPTTEMD